MSERLNDWEIHTIEALADEHLADLQTKQYVRNADALRDRFIVEEQRDCLNPEKPMKRRSLATQANRLGIGIVHPPRVDEQPDLDLPTPDDALASRWCRITLLKLKTPRDHEWSRLFADVVTRHVETHRHTTNPWRPADEGIGIIDLLEMEAERHGLIAGHAPNVDAAKAVRTMVGSA